MLPIFPNTHVRMIDAILRVSIFCSNTNNRLDVINHPKHSMTVRKLRLKCYSGGSPKSQDQHPLNKIT